MSSKLMIAVLIAGMFALFAHINSYSKPLSIQVPYNGITIDYWNRITIQSSTNWNAGLNVVTIPRTQMDRLGATVWTTYRSCNNQVVGSTVHTYTSQNHPWLLPANVSAVQDGKALLLGACPSNQTRRVHNHIVYYWKGYGVSADGRELHTSSIIP